MNDMNDSGRWQVGGGRWGFQGYSDMHGWVGIDGWELRFSKGMGFEGFERERGAVLICNSGVE